MQVLAKGRPTEDEIPSLCDEIAALEAATEVAAKQLAKFESARGMTDLRRSIRDIDAAVRAHGVQ